MDQTSRFANYTFGKYYMAIQYLPNFCNWSEPNQEKGHYDSSSSQQPDYNGNHKVKKKLLCTYNVTIC